MLCRCVRTVLVESVSSCGDLLVDLALGEHAAGRRARGRRAGTASTWRWRWPRRRPAAARTAPRRSSLGAEAGGARDAQHLGRRDARALLVVGEHVGEADERGLALDLVGLWWRSIGVAIDAGRPQRRASTPPTSAWSTPSSRRSWWMRSSGVRAPRWTWDGIAGVGVHQHELADVVQQARRRSGGRGRVADLAGEQVGRVLGGERVQAEALGRRVPDARALEEVEGAHALGELLDGLRAEDARRRRRRSRPRAAARRGTRWRGAARRRSARCRTRRPRRPRRSATWSLPTTASRRLRDSASAGNASSASKAASGGGRGPRSGGARRGSGADAALGRRGRRRPCSPGSLALLGLRRGVFRASSLQRCACIPCVDPFLGFAGHPSRRFQRRGPIGSSRRTD